MVRTTLTSNVADDMGGGLLVSGGTVVLSDGTLLVGNTALAGASLQLDGGALTYALPGRRLCAIVAADTDFLIGVAAPIVVGTAAAAADKRPSEGGRPRDK